MYFLKRLSQQLSTIDLYLYSHPVFQLSATNSMHAELIEDDGESRYKVTDIIGKASPFYVNLNVPRRSKVFLGTRTQRIKGAYLILQTNAIEFGWSF